MSRAATSSRPFEPGTTGWTVHDLDDPEIERQWFQGRYEIVEGVLTKMPPAYFAGGNALFNVMFLVKTRLKRAGLTGRFSTEVDVVVDDDRLARSDAVMMTTHDESRQKKAGRAAGRSDPKRTRILIPPTLIIESISPGHEHHDLKTKRRWYAEFGVPNYWILDGYAESLECLVLEGGKYRRDAFGRRSEEVRPSLFPGLVFSLAEIWRD